MAIANSATDDAVIVPTGALSPKAAVEQISTFNHSNTLDVTHLSHVTADCLPPLPNSIHRPDTIAYRIEQLDRLDQQLRSEQEQDGIFSSNNTQDHLAWNPRRSLDFRPCGFI